MIYHWFKALRVHHYIKNGLIFAPLCCSGQFFQADKLYASVWGFLAFSAIASLIYLINDIRDIEADRQHPVKCKRPLAAGKISLVSAYIAVGLLMLGSLVLNGLVFHWGSSLILAAYLLLNLAYSMGWKNIPLLDIAILSSGFVFRMIYGAIITEITISDWLYLTVCAFAFCMALGKRRNELQKHTSGMTRRVLKHYTVNFLDKNLYLCLSLTNIFYALWCTSPITAERYGTNLIWSVPLVLLISMKYSLNIEGKSDGDPVEVLIKDYALIFMVLAYLLTMFIIMYVL